MQTQAEFKRTTRRRFRSFKYNVVHSHLDSKFEPLKTEYTRSRNKQTSLNNHQSPLQNNQFPLNNNQSLLKNNQTFLDNNQSLPNHKQSIINPNKLRSYSNLKKATPMSNRTIDATSEKQNYLQTFLSFINKTKKQQTQERENNECMVLVPRFHSSFEKQESDFSFLDTMTKPVEFIENSLHSATKELKNQKNSMSLLKSELQTLNNKTNACLEEMQKETRRKVKILVENMRINEVLQNQRKLRNKKEIRLLEKIQASNSNICRSMEERSVEVEQRIFNCHPFDFNLDGQVNQQSRL